MTFQQNQPSIVILSNKLQDDRASRSLSDLSKHVPQAEIEYENMCRKLEVAGNVKQIEAIGEMVSSLRNGQIKCAKTHAPRVQQAMQLYQKTLLRVADEKGIIDTRGSGGQVRLAAPPETNPDYNNYGTTEARRDQVSDRRNISRDEQLREPRREVSPSRRTSERMNDTEYRKTQFPGHRQDQRGGNRSSQKREEAAGEAQMKRRLDQMSDSMEASVRLRKDNPNLADLSDALRPTKLAEKYTELYDNNWTDAFEELHDKCSLSEGRVIKCLLKILMKAYERSNRKASEQIKAIEDEVRRLVTFKVSTDHGVSGTKDMLRGDIGSLRQYRKSIAMLSVPELQQSFVSSYLRDILKEYGCRGNLPHVLEYANKCVEITWLMSVQDPPVILDNMKDHHGFHTEMYKAFTKHGRNVDFYVWPALLLHEGGPLLAKGVAQGN